MAVDFSGLSLQSLEAAPLSSLLARSALSCAVLTALRLCTTYASAVPSSLDYQTAMSLFLALTVIAVVFLTRSTLARPLFSSPLSSLLVGVHAVVVAGGVRRARRSCSQRTGSCSS